jgi:hypothetical protein
VTALEDIDEFNDTLFGHRLVLDLGDDSLDKVKQLERGQICVGGAVDFRIRVPVTARI